MFYMLVFVFFIWLAYLHEIYGKRGKLLHLIPGPPSLPLVGNMYHFMNCSPEKLFDKLLLFGETYDPIWKVYLPFVFTAIGINHPDDVEILLKSSKHIDKGRPYKYMRPWLKTSVLTSSGAKWRARRKMLTSAFHFGILKKYFDVIEKESKRSIEKLSLEGNEFDMNLLPFFSDLALNIISESAMGVDINELETKEIISYRRAIFDMGQVVVYRVLKPYIVDALFHPMINRFAKLQEEVLKILNDFSTKRLLAMNYVFLRSQYETKVKNASVYISKNFPRVKYEAYIAHQVSQYLCYVLQIQIEKTPQRVESITTPDSCAAPDAIDAIILQIIRERRAFHSQNNFQLLKIFDNMDKNNPIDTDSFVGRQLKLSMLDLLLSVEFNGQIDEDGIREEVNTFIWTGHESSEMGMAFLLLLLAENKEHQEKARQEACKVLSNSNGNLSIDDLRELDYLGRCIKESLRLYPTAPIVIRHITEDLHLTKYILPAGSDVCVSFYKLHRRPDFWPEATKFNPDRFLPDKIQNRHPFSYLPFSAGPRNCIGQKFAMNELKAISARILYHYDLEPITKTREIKFSSNLTLKPTKPLYVKFKKINR